MFLEAGPPGLWAPSRHAPGTQLAGQGSPGWGSTGSWDVCVAGEDMEAQAPASGDRPIVTAREASRENSASENSNGRGWL